MADLTWMYKEGFDTDKAAQDAGGGGDFEPIPKGNYRVRVVSIDQRQTKAGNGEAYNVRLDVVGPSHAGRVIFDYILIKHPSEEAVRIGRGRWAQLIRACGLSNPPTTDPLLGQEVQAFVKIEKSAEYGDKNVVGLYSKPDNGAPPPNITGRTPAAAANEFNDDDIPF
jgi:hypothetical protein